VTKVGEIISLKAIEGRVLGFGVYRGFGSLSDLARISQADIYDKQKNPEGTQRDLRKKHARDAYEYARNVGGQNFFPEVTLSLREPSVINFKPSASEKTVGFLDVDLSLIKQLREQGQIAISRLDGNHRLYYADGSEKGFEPLDGIVGFCLVEGIDRRTEIRLFRDINSNQMRMNTSHLDNILARLTPEERLKFGEPELYIAKKLGEDQKSALYQMVYEGGVKPSYFTIPLRTLKSGIKALRSTSRRLKLLANVDAEYRVVSNYWGAIREWQSDAWEHPRDYLVLRGAGLWAICYVGAEVIDRCLEAKEYDAKTMLQILRSGKEWDWRGNGHFRGYSGQGGARRIAEEVVREFETETEASITSLTQKILGDE
jgi:DGQHR domain-containing protein